MPNAPRYNEMKKAGFIFIVFLFTIIQITKSSAENKHLPDSSSNLTSTGTQFIENKGQWNNNIEFMADVPNGKMYIQEDAISYIFYNEAGLAKHKAQKTIEQNQRQVFKSHIFRVSFIGAKTKSTTGHRPFSEYHNYYIGNDRERWASKVSLYKQVTQNDIYPFTDMNIYGDDFNLKYDFVVKPNGNPNNIKMEYLGVDDLNLKNGFLHIKTSVNEIVEDRPYAFQKIEGQTVEVKCNFKLQGNIVTFEFPEGYDNQYKLTIDPKLIFSTFSGSYADNWGFTATFDDYGQVYSGGVVFGPNWQNIPGDTMFLPTLGAYQDTFAGGTYYPCDMGIIKYTTGGTSRIYSTYLGGALNECPHSLVVSGNGDLLILGTTGSANFPTSIFTYDSTFNGGSLITSSSSIQYPNGSDIVVSKLSNDGTALMSSTYIGGTGNDGLNTSTNTRYNYGDDFRGEIIADANGDCYIASTTSSTDFPIANGFQGSFGGGTQDGCVFKLNNNFTSLIWSSYLGGANSDAAYAVQFDLSYDVYVCGGTNSADFPVSSGALNPSLTGDVDGFVTHMSSNGANIVGSTYLGTPQYDQAYFVQLDSSDNVYVLGQTMGSYPVVFDSIAGTIYSNPGGNQFIHKLNNLLSETAFSTVYGTGGGIPDISPSAFLVNNCENIFVSGWGGTTGSQQGSTFGLPVTGNAYQPSTDGSDFHLLVLFKDAISLLYATFFGGPVSNEHVDGGTSRFDKNGIVYQSVCGGCGGNSDYPTTPGVWSNTNNSPNCNNAVFKFDMSNITANFDVLPQDEGCVPFTATFLNQSNGGMTYFWDFGDSTYSNLKDVIHTYTDTGTYNVVLVITDSATCQVKDSAFSIIKVHPLPILSTSPDASICPGQTTSLSGYGGGAYIWTPANSLSCSACQFPIASPLAATTYWVTVIDNNGCQADDSINIGILPIPDANAGFDMTICPNNPVMLIATGGISYLWTPDSTLNNASIQNPMANPSATTDYIVTVTDSNGCDDSDTIQVIVQNFIIADAGPDTAICYGDSAMLLATGGATYFWSPATGLNNPNLQNPIANPIETITYTVTVTSGLCTDNDSITIVVNPLPIADAGPNLTICSGDTATLSASGGNVFLWSTYDSTAIIDVQPNTTTSYSVIVFDNIGCMDSDVVVVNINNAPIASAEPDTIICEGESATLTAYGGNTYLWNTGKPGNTLIVSPQETTIYWVSVFDTAGCHSEDSVLVEVILKPEALIEIAENGGCAPFTVDFINNSEPNDSSLSYFWDFGDPVSGANNNDTTPEPSHTYELPGLYTATLSISHNICTGLQSMTASTQVVINAIPTAGFIIDPAEASYFEPNITFSDNSSGALNCILITGNGDTLSPCNTTYTYTDTGLFKVIQIVFNDIGCADTAEGFVYIKPEYIFFIANSFTPNGDGINDVYLGQGMGIKSFEMYIYDRWGDQIFKSENISTGWDGTANNGKSQAQQDVYVYLIKIVDFLDLPHTYIGRVSIIK